MTRRFGGVATLFCIVLVAALSLACYGGTPNGFPRTELQGGSGTPCLFQAFDERGEAAASWHGLLSSPCVIGWMTDPEFLLFYASTVAGRAIVAGDPASGELFTVAETAGVGRLHIEAAEGELILEQFGMPNSIFVGTPIQVAETERDLAHSERFGWRLVDDLGVTFGGDVVARDRNMHFAVSVSPSGRWTVVAERQKSYTHMLYRMSPHEDVIEAMGDAEYDVLGRGPMVSSQGSATSPDGSWTAEIGSEIRLTRSDGHEVHVEPMWLRWLPDRETGSPVWSPDGTAFAFRAGWDGSHGITIVGIDGSVRPLVEGLVELVVDWTEAGLSWVAWGGDGGH